MSECTPPGRVVKGFAKNRLSHFAAEASDKGDSQQSYLDRITRALELGIIPPGTVCAVEVRHDDDCPKLRGAGPCRCNPEIEIRPIRERDA